MKLLIKGFVSIVAVLLISGCSTNAPLDTLYYQGTEADPQKSMIVFLRGRGGSHEDFATEGFVSEVRMRALPFDMAAPDAHFGYYFGETLVPRLKADVIEPAKKKGYERFWLVGASMGGLGALMYTRFHPDDIEGVYVISPFLGYDKIIREIEAAGGVRNWQPGAYDPDVDWQRMLWDWLKQCAEDGTVLPDLYLAYGTEDSLVPGQKLLGELLPSEHVFTISGGHTPEVMKKLWFLFLEKDILH